MWWKVFNDKTEAHRIFPRYSLGRAWTVGYLLVLCLLLGVLGQASVPYLALPVVLMGLYVLLSYVTGAVGMALLSPLAAFGWLCLVLYIAYGGPVIGSTVAQFEALMVAMLIPTFLIILPHVRAKLLIPVVGEGIFYACLTHGVIKLLVPRGEGSDGFERGSTLIRQMSNFYLSGLLIIAGIVLVIMLVSFARSLASDEGMWRGMLGYLKLVGLGFLAPLVGSMLAPVSPVAAVVGTAACYAALAVVATRWNVEHLSWAFVPLMLLSSLALLKMAPLDYLPAQGVGTTMVHMLREGPLGAIAEVTTTPLVKAMGTLWAGPVNRGVQLLMMPPEAIGAAVKDLVFVPLLEYVEDLVGQVGQVGDATLITNGNVTPDASGLVWSRVNLPADAPLTRALGTYLLIFVSCVVAGTVMEIMEPQRGKPTSKEALEAAAFATVMASLDPSMIRKGAAVEAADNEAADNEAAASAPSSDPDVPDSTEETSADVAPVENPFPTRPGRR